MLRLKLIHVSKRGYWQHKSQGIKGPGDRLNIKMLSYQYGDPHVKDKTVSWLSYL